MKKLLAVFFALALISLPVCAAQYDASKKVQTVGENILTKNGIPSNGVKFMVVSGDVDNSNYSTTKVINVSSNDLAYVGNDNELAAVVANEIGHIVSGHASKGKVASLLQSASGTTITTNETASTLVSNYKTAKEEKEADIIASNMLVTSGYNPLALIVVLTKQQSTALEAIQGKPANADRAMSVYNYMLYAHPAKVKAGYGCNEYRNFLTYANPIVKERQANKKAETKNLKEQEKAKKNSVSTLTKFKTRGGMSGWDAAYGLLNGAN